MKVNKLELVKGNFIEGEYVIVSIDGKEYRRKVKFSRKWGDLIITVNGKEFSYHDVEFL